MPRTAVSSPGVEHSADLVEALGRIGEPLHLDGPSAFVPPVCPENLGDPEFLADHGLRAPYLSGAMANGIGSVALVCAMCHAGLLGFFGAAGLDPQRVEEAVNELQRTLNERPWGVNLIHSPNEPDLEAVLAEMLIRRQVRRVEASAYLDLTLPLVRYRLYGIHTSTDGRIVTPNTVFAKVSRVEIARKFFAPPPEKLVRELVRAGHLSEEQAILATRVPVAQDLTAEADSGGHTDNRPAITLLPTLLALRDRLQEQYGYPDRLRVGAAGGIATPASVLAAFSMGAAYVLTGSINQACVESGSSDEVRRMLSQAEQADTIMAPSADMFEMGVKVQVLKRGTMFPMRAAKLYELYRTCNSLDDIPLAERTALEKNVFRAPLATIWEKTRAFWQQRDVAQVERAQRDPKHLMALVFRWYLGLSSRWANVGDPERKVDYQVWCGPAMGAFNEWTRGTDLERPENRRVAVVARNLLRGACVLQRVHIARVQGVQVDDAAVARLTRPSIADCGLWIADSSDSPQSAIRNPQ
jgi:PfaD family protein